MASEALYITQQEAGELTLPPPCYDGQAKPEHATAVLRYVDSKILYDHPYRVRMQSMWRKAELFRQSLQWLMRSYNDAVVGQYTAHWAVLDFREDDPDAIPTPTYDEFSSVQENEASRLGRPEYKPYVRPTGENPDAKVREGAKLAEQALNQSLEDMLWDDIEHEGHHHMPLYGGWILKSWWDVSWDRVTEVGSRKAMKCPSCEFKVSDPELSPEIGLKFRDQVNATQEIGEDGGVKQRFNVDHCLTCQDHEELRFGEMPEEPPPEGAMPPVAPKLGMRPERIPGPPKLESFTPVDAEIHEQDYFGRPMSEPLPMGQWMLKTCSPHDIFWRNLGLDERLNQIREVTEVHVETLDWVRARYPQKAKEIKRESPEALQRYHPIAGERALYYAGAGHHAGGGLFQQQVRVKEYHHWPHMAEELDENGSGTGVWKLNRGRSVIIANGVLLLDGDFMVESKTRPGVLIPRVHYDYAPWELRSGGRELSGVSLSESLFDAQENINEEASQDQDARQRHGSPKWLVERSMNLSYETIGAAGAHYLYDSIDPNQYPREIGGTAGIPGMEQKTQNKIEYMARRAGTSDVEFGNVPPGVDSGTMLQILADQTSERRRPRIRRIREMLQRCWSHGLVLMEEFVREPRKLWVKGDGDNWRERAWSGMDFQGQTAVRIDPEPEHDTALVKRQNVRDGVTLGVLDPQNPKAAVKIAKHLDLPAALTATEDMQDLSAEREFIDFLEQDEEPMVDPDKDDPIIHSDRHGADLHNEKWRDLEKRAKWKDALKVLWGWNSPTMPGPPVPQVDPVTGQPALDPMTGQPIMVPGEPLSPFNLIQQMREPTGQWPRVPELQILAVWSDMLAKQPLEGSDEEALYKVLRARAHLAAHKQAQTEQQTAAAGGAQVPAAPGGVETAAGTVPAATEGTATQPMPEGY